MEGVAGIFQFIKDSRLQRKGLVRHQVRHFYYSLHYIHQFIANVFFLQDHYIFCYEVIADFSDTMGLYDNFRNVV